MRRNTSNKTSTARLGSLASRETFRRSDTRSTAVDNRRSAKPAEPQPAAVADADADGGSLRAHIFQFREHALEHLIRLQIVVVVVVVVVVVSGGGGEGR